MSNWTNRIQLWFYEQLNRLFIVPPKHLVDYGFNAIDVSGLERYGTPLDECQNIMVDECFFVINHDDNGNWMLDEDLVSNIQIWGDKGDIFIQFEDENEWWELKIINTIQCPKRDSKTLERIKEKE